MNNKICSLVFLFLCQLSFAQMRLSVSAGPVLSVKDKKQDTAFFSGKGFQEKIKIGFYKGRLGLVVTGGFIQQKPGAVAEEGRLPQIKLGLGAVDSSLGFTGGNLTTTYFAFAPQLCFPVNKIKIHFFIGGGIAVTNADSAIVTLKSNAAQTTKNIYYNTEDNGTAPVLFTGLNIQLPIVNKLALDVGTEYIQYKLTYFNFDRRSGFLRKSRTDQKQLISFHAGFTIKF
jgi:hypothetical protein